ncbi:hypothetical protein V2J09_001986 [Rumex salicifolius]
MDVQKIFHMRGGHGDSSYARNSSIQRKGSEMAKHITMAAIDELYQSIAPPRSTVSMADMGCSSGPNTLSVVRDLYRAVEIASRDSIPQAPAAAEVRLRSPEVVVYLNDLPSTDFNSVFKALPDLYAELREDRGCAGDEKPPLFVSAFPGSFYERLFPSASLHFVYSSYSLHWLSKVPLEIYDENGDSMNKASVYITRNSPASVIRAYESQFREDFMSFLQLRAQELVKNGRMVLLLLGRQTPKHFDRGNSFFWELFSRSFSILVSQGLVEQEKVDSYDVHFYAPSREEIEMAVQAESSFSIERLETLCIESEEQYEDGISHGTAVAKAIRAIQESMLTHHFGQGPILDQLFAIYAALIDEETSIEAIRPITYVIDLAKR